MPVREPTKCMESAERDDSFRFDTSPSLRSISDLEDGAMHEEVGRKQQGKGSSETNGGKRLSMLFSQIVSNNLSYDSNLVNLGFTSEVKDKEMFARGVVQIVRALHCYPCRRAEVEQYKYSHTNLLFLKLYHNHLYRRLVYLNIFLLLMFPFIGNKVNDKSQTESILTIFKFGSFARPATVVCIVFVFVDILVKCMAYGKLVYWPRFNKEVLSIYTLFVCNCIVLLQVIWFGWSPEDDWRKMEVKNNLTPITAGIVFLRTPFFRAVMLLARSHNLQHDFFSKLYSLKKSLPIVGMALAIFLILCITLTVVVGVVIIPDMREKTFHEVGNEISDTTQYEFYPAEPKTQILLRLWKNEMDSSFKSFFHTMMTLFVGMTYTNYYKIFSLLWAGIGEALGTHTSLLSEGGIINTLPRIIASFFIGFFAIFILIMDCIIVAVCVNGFAEHRSKSAEYTMKQEIGNLESAFEFLCASAEKDHITKDMWMEILLASGRRLGRRKANDGFVEASILVFEMLDMDCSNSLEKKEFVDACVKGLLGKVKKKSIQVVGRSEKSDSWFSNKFWTRLSIVFDTVGGNSLWVLYSLIQAVFTIWYWDRLAHLVDDAIVDTQDSLSEKIFNRTYGDIKDDKNFYEIGKECSNSPLPFNISNVSTTIKFEGGEFQREFADSFKDAYDEKMKTFVTFDTIFLVLAFIECLLRIMAFKRRSKVYPTFQKKVLPKMEMLDLLVVLFIISFCFAWSVCGTDSDGDMFHRFVLATRGIRVLRFLPAVVRFRSADHSLLIKRRQSGKNLNRNEWINSLFNFEMRIDINYDKKNFQSKSSKGPIMRIGNTFVHCFWFALRQILLIGLLIYLFTCWFQALLYWVPCTIFGDYQGTDNELSSLYGGNCEMNNVDNGFLNVSLVFYDFGRTFAAMLFTFFMKDPQEIFAYVIQLADEEEYKDVASKKLVFAAFFSYYLIMIVFVYNFVTAEIMQICDLLRFNMLHQVDVAFLKPKNSDFVYCIEWKLNMTSRRGGMIIEYYTKRLHASGQNAGEDGDEALDQEHEVQKRTQGRRPMNRETNGGNKVDIPLGNLRKASVADLKEKAFTDDADGFELKEINLSEQRRNTRGADDDDSFQVGNPLNHASQKMRSRLSTGSAASAMSAMRNSHNMDLRRESLNIGGTKKPYTKRPSALDCLPTLVKSRELPHGEIWVDPRTPKSNSKNRPSLIKLNATERKKYEEKRKRTLKKQYSGIPYPPIAPFPDKLKDEWEARRKAIEDSKTKKSNPKK